MREIRFRVFDKALKEYRTPQGGDYSLGVLSGKVRGKYGEEFPELIVEQYTGLKDKNARKIFDGDILSDWTETDQEKVSSHCQVFFDEKHGQWSLDTSFYQNKSNPSPLWLELNDFEYEITGNIYENPELISNSNSN